MVSKTSLTKTPVRCLAIGKKKMSSRKYRVAGYGGNKPESFEIGHKIKQGPSIFVNLERRV
jgi:hypothetical protein